MAPGRSSHHEPSSGVYGQPLNRHIFLPLKDHPIFHLRKAIIIIAIIGILICCLGSSNSRYSGETFTASSMFLGLSTILCLSDLISYASNKVDHPDQAPEWPQPRWMLMDVVMALLLQLMFWIDIINLTMPYHSGTNILGAYGTLADFLCSLLHAWCFWKQLMARYKKRWLANLPKHSCPRCGYTENDSQTDTSARPPNNTVTYAGPSAEFDRANMLTPESPVSTMEEGLLIGSDFSSGYGSIERPEPTLSQPEGVVVAKGKGKKKSSSNMSGRAFGKKPVT